MIKIRGALLVRKDVLQSEPLERGDVIAVEDAPQWEPLEMTTMESESIYVVIGTLPTKERIIVECAVQLSGLEDSFKVRQWQSLYPEGAISVKKIASESLLDLFQTHAALTGEE